ncbi:uncharacterized protein LOC119986501 isoform X2 [Tripterygium wilfordii]|uniref:uncharacterized protein LOC119986501 isoform X2 n=1 Tax=Tripterygium wilfordii TaxID=458696 RepID=UPI0018F7E571|nr:uncharacterized protein LOC119986501 isoform X2 [Tripterygium wilfordii]
MELRRSLRPCRGVSFDLIRFIGVSFVCCGSVPLLPIIGFAASDWRGAYLGCNKPVEVSGNHNVFPVFALFPGFLDVRLISFGGSAPAAELLLAKLWSSWAVKMDLLLANTPFRHVSKI